MICLLWAFEESDEASRMQAYFNIVKKDSTWFGSNSWGLEMGSMDGRIPEAFRKFPWGLCIEIKQF